MQARSLRLPQHRRTASFFLSHVIHLYPCDRLKYYTIGLDHGVIHNRGIMERYKYSAPKDNGAGHRVTESGLERLETDKATEGLMRSPPPVAISWMSVRSSMPRKAFIGPSMTRRTATSRAQSRYRFACLC